VRVAPEEKKQASDAVSDFEPTGVPVLILLILGHIGRSSAARLREVTTGVYFIEENSGGPGVRLRKPPKQKR
jgi:hypothetical protein